MTSCYHMQTPLTTEAMSHASELSKVAQGIASRPQFSANIKTWQERMEGGSYLGMGCYVSGTDTVKTGYTGVRAQIAARDAEIADLRAALAAKAVPDGWQPIETAPKDGTRILVWLREPWSNVQAVKWFDMFKNWQTGDFPDEDDEYCGIGSDLPTHWMPLPPPPSPAESSHE